MVTESHNEMDVEFYEDPRCAICRGMINIPEDIVPLDRVTVSCGHFVHAHGLNVTFHREYSHVLAILLPLFEATCRMSHAMIKKIIIHMWTSASPPSMPCSLCTCCFPVRFETIIRFTYFPPTYEDILCPITLNTSDLVVLFDIFECSRADYRMIPYAGENHNYLQIDMEDDI